MHSFAKLNVYSRTCISIFIEICSCLTDAERT